MLKNIPGLHPFVFIVIATILEVSGDAIIRTSVYNHTGFARIGFMLVGTVLLFGYGLFINLAPVEFGKVVGFYIASLFVVWQTINYIAFGSIPTLPIIIGGSLIVSGGLLISFWK